MRYKTQSNLPFSKVINEVSQSFDHLAATPENQDLISPAILLIHLYGLIVFPWEQLKQRIQKDGFLRKTALDGWCRYQVLQHAPNMQHKEMRLYFVVEMMRHAIAHASITMDDEYGIVFHDRRGTKLGFQKEDLSCFLKKLKDYFLKFK